MRTNLICLILATIFILATAIVARAQGIEWTIVNWKVRHDFPDVRRITPAQVADWLKDTNRPQPVLLDVRTKPEFEVSHIHGAQQVDPGANADVIKTPRDKPIVTYCSVGYRSGSFAKKLQEAGFKDVQNMSGSIFEWANEGHPVERVGQRTNKVHPYNAKWAKLLKPELRADVPATGAGM